MYLPESVAKQIINLNPNPELNIIDNEVADRQFNVILKGFNYLMQAENNFLYIGDEVGLGKTYIALGIASLLRLYSEDPNSYTDTVIVPKENLQYKWQKEIRNFISNNYLVKDNIVKSVLGKPVGKLDKDTIKRKLSGFDDHIPQYVIYRNPSFSIASDGDEDSTVWIEKLKEKVPKDYINLFNQVCKKFKKEQILIKRAYAYIMNHRLSEIDLLIVDEAHNFKHGIGDHVSIRNQISSRMFGAVKSDPELFEHFPEFKEMSKSKVKKLILLSATPINNSLVEIKNQLDCFLHKHKFKNIEDENELEKQINKSLNKFMIRGVMTLKVNNKPYSRNRYRHEHRKGNVDMKELGEFQLLKDNETALVLSLMQYRIIKDMKLKSNNSFEMGMLAGFESFQKSDSKYEEDTLSNRRENKAKDEYVIKELVQSYYEKFNKYIPHPKQESLVKELFSLILNREKALVFVRRIASVRELERKLFKKYSDFLMTKIEKVTKGSNVPAFKGLKENYKNENIRDKIDEIIDILSERIYYDVRKIFLEKFDYDQNITQTVNADLREINDSLIENSLIDLFREDLKNNVGKKKLKGPLKEKAIKLLNLKWNNELILKDKDDEDDEITMQEVKYDEERAPYFFQRFFYNEGKNFKNRSYKKDWYELNLLLFNDKFNLFNLDLQRLNHDYSYFYHKVDIKRIEAINAQILSAIKSKEHSNTPVKEAFRSNTFITELLLNLCQDEMINWVNENKGLISGEYYSRFIDELNVLTEIIKSIFRQGSGLIPVFIAEEKTRRNTDSRNDFILEMVKLLRGEFEFVLDEVKDIIKDFRKIVDRNFDDINKIRYNLIQQLPVSGISGHHKKDVRKTAIQFRMPGYPYILITTDILKEGEDLHTYCKNIYHYGIAWNPSDMEQRTGRIDRIDSLAFRNIKDVEGKEIEGIPFNNKLQVFYPYLADTLEVNQMVKLFKGMDKFIEIFYNDLSAKIERDSKASVDEVVIDIPEQRKGLLESKYEYDSFVYQKTGEALNKKTCIGTCLDELKSKMYSVLESLQEYEYFIEPEFDDKELSIMGIMKINDRQGPFKIYFVQNHKPGEFKLYMESVLGRVQEFGRHANKVKTGELLDKAIEKEGLNFEIRESNSYAYVTLFQDINLTIEEILRHLYTLIKITDDIENEVTGGDETVEIN